MARRLDHGELEREIVRLLATNGPSAGSDIYGRMGISQPAFSRLVRRLGSEVLVTGRARSTLYMAPREIPSVGSNVPIYEIQTSGESRQLGTLHAVEPGGFYLESHVPEIASGAHDDLPYFLQDMRPAGFLGRLIPRRHPEISAPMDVRLWSADHCIRYLARHGWNHTGNLILGEEAFRLHLSFASSPPDRVEAHECDSRYPDLAENVLAMGEAGSSAAGEQPKFLVERDPGPVAVLVKFSPPGRDETSLRLADLLVCEHVAHEILEAHEHPAARSRIIESRNRRFLEVERFDRVPGGGRRGFISMLYLDAEFVGDLTSWSRTARSLNEQGIITETMLREIRWLECFGSLIANTDMHLANLSFFTRATRILGLTPAYDMLPMSYAPAHGSLPDHVMDVPTPRPSDADVWPDALSAAVGFWSRIGTHELVSADFRSIAGRNLAELRKRDRLSALLPG